MSIQNQILESVQPDRWCLAGLVTASPHLGPAGHSLKLIRDSDALSPSIRSAVNAETIIPVVEINTPSGTATLGNVGIVNIAPPATDQVIDVLSWSCGFERTLQIGDSGGDPHRSWRPGVLGVNLGGIFVPKRRRRLRKGFDFLEIELAFHSITISHKKLKGFTDDWSIPA
jgi:hypothetical protein